MFIPIRRQNTKRMIVIVCGLPGSGKSYFASLLAKRIKASYINSDRLRKKLFVNSLHTEKEKIEVYVEMLRQLKEALKENKNIVLDATFYKATIRKKFLDEIGGKDMSFIIEVKAGQRVIRKRLSKPRAYSEADFKIYKKIEKQWEPIFEKHLVLDSTDNNIDAMMLDALHYLRTCHDSRAGQ